MTPSLAKGPKAPRGLFDLEKPLPMTPEEVTTEWLSEALGVPVEDFEMTTISHGTSSKLFLDLTFADGVETDIPEKVCLKGGFNPVIRETVPEMWPTYRREAEFYYHVAPKTNMLLPKTWLCSTGTVNDQGVFIMSDVADECSFGTSLEPWAPDRVEEALWQLARLHGKTWNRKEEEYP